MAQSASSHSEDAASQPHQLPLGLDVGPQATLSGLKNSEAQLRVEADLYIEIPAPVDFLSIILPRRYEALEAEAKVRNLPLRPLVRPVKEALADIEREIRHVREMAMGRLYVITGVTGSGKTTFLNSLNLFVDGLRVHNVKGMALDNRGAIENALTLLRRKPTEVSIVVLEGRENPGSISAGELDLLLTTLNADLRGDTGRRTLFVIPTTSSSLAQSISQRAAEIGGMTSRERPFYVFTGPNRDQFAAITNETLSAFNDSRVLLDYGLADETVNGIAEVSESIGQFMENCYHEIMSRRGVLEARAKEVKHKRIHLWMVFCSAEDDLRRNYDITRSLTVGDRQSVQIQRILSGDSKEVREWQTKEAEFAQAAAYLDLRLLYLPMRTALAVVTAYAPEEIMKRFKDKGLFERETVRARAQESIANTAIGAFLNQRGFTDDPLRRGKLNPRQQAQFQEVMGIAQEDETILNAMIANALREWLNNPEIKVATEKALNNTHTLLTDIAVINSTDIYCLEMKWRSSVLQASEASRETVSRVTDFVKNLPELRHLLAS